MLFGKKDKEMKCKNCKSKFSDKFNFCPYCGNPTMGEQEEMQEFGLLGKNDFTKPKETRNNPFGGLGITDKLLNSVMKNMIESFEKQMNESEEPEFQGNADIEQLPNGIKIKIGIPSQAMPKKERRAATKKQLTDAQLKKMSNLPRTSARTNIRRLSDKVVYELAIPGIESTNDVFISKLETGYEIKAIGKKKVYVNSLPIDLPMKGFSILDNKLLVEFKLQK